jgi:hypothetical protein
VSQNRIHYQYGISPIPWYTSGSRTVTIYRYRFTSIIPAWCMLFLFTTLGCIFMGAVLFNGNVENRGAAYLSELLPNV